MKNKIISLDKYFFLKDRNKILNIIFKEKKHFLDRTDIKNIKPNYFIKVVGQKIIFENLEIRFYFLLQNTADLASQNCSEAML